MRESGELPPFETTEDVVNCHHNYVAIEHHYGEDVFVTRGPEEWVTKLESVEIPCGLVREFHEVMDHPQLAYNGLVTEVGSPVGTIPTIGSAIALGGDRPELGAVPALGEHTDEVLAELELSEAEIRAVTS